MYEIVKEMTFLRKVGFILVKILEKNIGLCYFILGNV